jgi:predicted metal-dependent enzyme (double-stranded beta helix superfamily)
MNAGTMSAAAVETNDLRSLSELPTDLALQQAAPILGRLVKDPIFFEGEIRPLLEVARVAEGHWYVARSYRDKDHNYSLQVFIWPPSTETKIHDHSSWGVYCCAVGSILEERYERLDDGSRLRHARLKKVGQRM